MDDHAFYPVDFNSRGYVHLFVQKLFYHACTSPELVSWICDGRSTCRLNHKVEQGL